MKEERIDLTVEGLARGGGSALTVQARDPRQWQRYIVDTDPDLVARHLSTVTFASDGRRRELLRFDHGTQAPAILISPGSSGTARVFAELGYHLSARGASVYIMPKQGPYTLTQLMHRHDDALRSLRDRGHTRIGVFAEGLGAYVAFYLALAGGPMDSLVCQNGPAIVTERAYRDAIFADSAGHRRRRLVPLARLLAKISPRISLPITSYLDFRTMIDPQPPAHDVEAKIIEAYGEDPDFDRRYPLSAILSLLDTPPPAPTSALAIPTMFLVPTRGITPAYERDLFARLPDTIDKQLVEVDGSVFWMVSHPRAAADVIGGWFDRTLLA